MSTSIKSEAPSVPLFPTCYGLSPPISEDLPAEAELTRTRQLMESLTDYGVFESDTEVRHRKKVIEKLESLFKEWLKEMCISMNVPETVTDKVGGKVLPFGSYLLGVDSKGADIDVVCVGPGFLEREEFFTSFFQKLQAQKEVTDIRAIKEAFVPVIKMSFDGIEMDVIYAKLEYRSIPDRMNVLNSQLLKDIDKQSARSLNGYRVTAEILQLVPNADTFRLALRAIKLWAKRRNIYSNMLGFLGGVSWAILVARICQVYPNATASTLVIKFFKVYAMWDWPIPVGLQRVEDLGFNLPFWNPALSRADWRHLMPIITPAYPQQNTSVNVSLSTFHIIVEEISRGHAIAQEIEENQAEWSKLFDQPDFFKKYKHYILLRASSASERQHLEWVSMVESKIRLLVGDLERHMNITQAHVNLESSTAPSDQEGLSTVWQIGLLFDMQAHKHINVDLTTILQAFTNKVYSLADSCGVYEEGMTVSAICLTKMANLSWEVADGEYKSVFTVAAEPTVSQPAPLSERAAVSPGQPAMKGKDSSDHESPATRPEADTKPVTVTEGSSGQSSTARRHVTAPRSPQTAKRRLPPDSASPSPKKLKISEEPVQETEDTSSEESSAGVSLNQIPSPTVSSKSTGRPGATGHETPGQKQKLELNMPTVELSDSPSCNIKTVAIVKRGIKLRLCRQI